MGLDVAQVKGVDARSVMPHEIRSHIESVAQGATQSRQGYDRLRNAQEDAYEVAAWVRALPTGAILLALVEAQTCTGPDAGARRAPSPSRLTLCALDHEWRFTEISLDAADVFGWRIDEYRDMPMQSVVHPDDVDLLLGAFGRASSDRRAVSTTLRVRYDDGGWLLARCEASPLCEHNPPRMAVAVSALGDGEQEATSDRIARLEDHLWRIAIEVAAAGIGGPAVRPNVWWGDPSLQGLSQRQLDIVRRLLRGERVPTIARDLYLSQSTVRNHLAAVYRRLGVHSQAELLARLIPQHSDLE